MISSSVMVLCPVSPSTSATESLPLRKSSMMAVSIRSWRALRLSVNTCRPSPNCVVRWKWRLP